MFNLCRGFIPRKGEKMFFISQLGKQDCAFACLKMMLANYHKDRNYLYLPCNLNRSYSFQDLTVEASKYNMTLLGVKIDNAEELIKCKQFPLIVTLQKKNVRHSVLVVRANAKYVYVYDPDLGKRKIQTEIFLSEWTSRALIVKEFTPTKCPRKFGDFVMKKDKIILPVLQILSGASLLIGTYFLSDQGRYYIPIIFFSLFAILEIIFRWSLVNAMRNMDELINSHEFNVNKEEYPELYKCIEKYRQVSLSLLPNFIYACLISIFVTIILVINGPVNAIYVFLPMALAFIEVFLYKPYFKSKSIEVMEKENELNEVETSYQFKMKSGEAHSIAYQLGLNRGVFSYLEIVVLLLTIVVTMTITNTFNITYVVFYLCISFFLKQNFCRLFEFSSQYDECVVAKAKIINSIKEESNN